MMVSKARRKICEECNYYDDYGIGEKAVIKGKPSCFICGCTIKLKTLCMECSCALPEVGALPKWGPENN